MILYIHQEILHIRPLGRKDRQTFNLFTPTPSKAPENNILLRWHQIHERILHLYKRKSNCLMLLSKYIFIHVLVATCSKRAETIVELEKND